MQKNVVAAGRRAQSGTCDWRVVITIVVALAWCVPSAAVDARQAPAETIRSAEPAEALPHLQRRLESEAAAGRFSGGVLVAEGDRILLRRTYGMANHALKLPLAPDSRFRLASLSKQFTAAAVLRLQDRGVLRTDDPVCRWVQPCPKAWEPMLLKHLLAHRSGIPDLMARPGWAQARMTPKTPEQLTLDSSSLALQFEPGAKSRYNNAGFNLAGVVVENASGMPFHEFLRQEFFEQLGMKDTGFDGGSVPGLAMGYADLAEGLTPQPRSNASVVFAAGGLYSTLDDMLRWQRALHRGRVLSGASYAEMIADHDGAGTAIPSDGIPRGWGYGLFTADLGRHVTPAFSATQIFHTGSWAGFRNLVSYQPDADVTVIVLANNYHRRDAVFLIAQQAMAEAMRKPLVKALQKHQK